MPSKKDSLNQANLNSLADLLREFKIGDVIRAQPTYLRKQLPVAGTVATGNLTTVSVLKLPNDAKAVSVLRASSRAGTVTGELAPQAYATTPATTQVAVTPCGDIAVLGTDAITDLDVVYLPEKGEVVSFEADLVTGVLTLPAAWVSRGVVLLLDATVTAGTITGGKRISAPVAGAGLPATTVAQLTSNKSTVSFNVATDGATRARVTCLIGVDPNGVNSADVNALLQANASY